MIRRKKKKEKRKRKKNLNVPENLHCGEITLTASIVPHSMWVTVNTTCPGTTVLVMNPWNDVKRRERGRERGREKKRKEERVERKRKTHTREVEKRMRKRREEQ